MASCNRCGRGESFIIPLVNGKCKRCLYQLGVEPKPKAAKTKARGICNGCGRDDCLIQARGLCKTCYRNPVVKAENPTQSELKTEPLTSQIAPRQDGDAPHWCMWCGQWKCQEPIKKCAECQAEYQRRIAETKCRPLPDGYGERTEPTMVLRGRRMNGRRVIRQRGME